VLGDLTYEYDKNGNRTKIGGSFARTGIPQAIASTAYNAANHQTTFGDKTLTYDNNGNLQTITDASGTTTYTWNARNQLTGISGPGVSTIFVYDGLGRREKKTINGSLTEFLYDGLNPVQETSGANILANILPGLGIDEFLTRTDVGSGATSSFLPNALGSSLALTDASGAVQTEYTYEPFGKTSATGASNTSSYQYTGRENDGTGLYYYRARYYHPELQRFVSEDPLNPASVHVNAHDETRPYVVHAFISEMPNSTDLYNYVDNNPTNITDPSGLIGLGGAAGLGAGLGAGTGWIGARKPLIAAAFGALFGATYSPLIAAVPLYGPVGGVVGFVAGFGTGLAVAAVGSGGHDTAGAVAAGVAGGIGGFAGGYVGGWRGATIAAGVSAGLVIGYGQLMH
jgi:RHS repeat-associated protein